jgi:hypothetical protein
MRPTFATSIACANSAHGSYHAHRGLRAGDVVSWPSDPRDLGDVHECGERDFLVVWRIEPSLDPDDFDPRWPLEGPRDADIVAPCGVIRGREPLHVVLVEERR